LQKFDHQPRPGPLPYGRGSVDSQKEPEKALHESIDPAAIPELHKMKSRIEVIGDFEDLKKVKELLKQSEYEVIGRL
jgi:hypothetical protein